MAKLIENVYGDALFETAAEHGTISEVYEEVLEVVRTLLEEPEFIRLLNHPRVTRDERMRALEACLRGRISEELMGFLHLVVEKNRQESLFSMLRHFTDRVKDYRGIADVYVTSAVELDGGQRMRLEDSLKKTSRYREFQMYYTVDFAILGGLVVRVGDRVIDNSIKTRLELLERQLSDLQLT